MVLLFDLDILTWKELTPLAVVLGLFVFLVFWITRDYTKYMIRSIETNTKLIEVNSSLISSVSKLQGEIDDLKYIIKTGEGK